jgi:hypothetical protein
MEEERVLFYLVLGSFSIIHSAGDNPPGRRNQPIVRGARRVYGVSGRRRRRNSGRFRALAPGLPGLHRWFAGILDRVIVKANFGLP